MTSDPKTIFVGAFDTIVSDLKSEINRRYDLPEEAKEYLLRNIQYNVPHGKLNRGLAVVEFVKNYLEESKEEITETILFQASVLGWCVEFLQAFFLVADDIMDASETRRGQPCFYKLPEIGLKAVNDSIVLEALLYTILQKYFREQACYLSLVDLFHEITFTTALGQMLDLTTAKEQGDVDLESFSADNLVRIYRYKTAYYSFYLPVALGMRLSGVSDNALFDLAKDICIEMGIYFQAQDDYIDCFGDPAVTGKIGTDIQDNKCTWLIVEALKVASEDDKKVLENNYGRPEDSKVAEVKAIYTKLNVKDRFLEYEKECHSTLLAKIENAKTVMPTGAFTFLLSKIFKRSK